MQNNNDERIEEEFNLGLNKLEDYQYNLLFFSFENVMDIMKKWDIKRKSQAIDKIKILIQEREKHDEGMRKAFRDFREREERRKKTNEETKKKSLKILNSFRG